MFRIWNHKLTKEEATQNFENAKKQLEYCEQTFTLNDYNVSAANTAFEIAQYRYIKATLPEHYIRTAKNKGYQRLFNWLCPAVGASGIYLALNGLTKFHNFQDFLNVGLLSLFYVGFAYESAKVVFDDTINRTVDSLDFKAIEARKAKKTKPLA